jgi:mRNA interferase HigB
MHIIALRALREFWEKHPQAETPLRGWYAEASRAAWQTPADIKAAHRNASFLANNRVVFNIKGNDDRLVVAVRYTSTQRKRSPRGVLATPRVLRYPSAAVPFRSAAPTAGG